MRKWVDWLWPSVVAAWLIGCAGSPVVEAGQSAVWGYLRLIPRAGVERTHAGAYGDRRLSGLELVDYSQPGFAVVYVTEPDRNSNPLELTILAAASGVRLEPALAAQRANGIVQIHNATASTHTISCPQAGAVAQVSPGGRLEVRLAEGLHDFFVLDSDDATSRVFAAPGRFDVVSSAGRFEISGVEPGSHWLKAWHPRFPPVSTRLELAPGSVRRVDLEMGVSLGEE